MGSEAGWIANHLHADRSPNLILLLATVALAIGMQSGAMVQLNIPGIVTTYITGTWTTMLSGMVRLATRGRQQAPQQNLEFEHRLLLQAVCCRYIFSSCADRMALPVCTAGRRDTRCAAVLMVAIHGALQGRVPNVGPRLPCTGNFNL